jgi:hypothetical protein
MEYGTGKAGDPAVSHKGSHFPPSAALNLWARNHGIPSGYLVARAIARRGGLRARRWLRDVPTQAKTRIVSGALSQLAKEINQIWGNK